MMIDAQGAAGIVRTVVVTGTGGLGFEAALALARLDFAIILAGRNLEKGSRAAEFFVWEVPGCSVIFEPLDLASRASVGAFSKRMLQRRQRIDVLINNAGVMSYDFVEGRRAMVASSASSRSSTRPARSA